MKKLIFVLLASIAVFTYISALDKGEEKPMASAELFNDLGSSLKIIVENNQ